MYVVHVVNSENHHFADNLYPHKIVILKGDLKCYAVLRSGKTEPRVFENLIHTV